MNYGDISSKGNSSIETIEMAIVLEKDIDMENYSSDSEKEEKVDETPV